MNVNELERAYLLIALLLGTRRGMLVGGRWFVMVRLRGRDVNSQCS